ncbi:hypothetical protein [Bradyrhizobium sp. CSS354]|uniref:hypothetical protein n=1 Tax=Bradyrhizobium sp. CSS354 TaxID=2699172 RepID=UPI0023B1ACF7|nr:hypothetical protein [Bradyrhizobium sp. CSS354]MDE5461152.1 hypothetical protein [Bradyrhizobium sp. CSS354]
MSELIRIPGGGVAVRPTKKAGHALIAATLDAVHPPLSVAGQCRNELRGELERVRDGLHRYDLPAAKANHAKMLQRAALVRQAHVALLAVAYPHIVRTPTITPEIALAMVGVLFRGVGRAKGVEANALTASCVAMFDPRSDLVGAATELWTPVSTHPVVLALAVQKLQFNTIFTSTAELRTAMQEARSSVVWLVQATERWLDLLRTSDRLLFEHDRAAWDLAYSNVGADVVLTMQDPDEAGYEGDDECAPEPAAPRWTALEAIRLARLSE